MIIALLCWSKCVCSINDVAVNSVGIYYIYPKVWYSELSRASRLQAAVARIVQYLIKNRRISWPIWGNYFRSTKDHLKPRWRRPHKILFHLTAKSLFLFFLSCVFELPQEQAGWCIHQWEFQHLFLFLKSYQWKIWDLRATHIYEGRSSNITNYRPHTYFFWLRAKCFNFLRCHQRVYLRQHRF